MKLVYFKRQEVLKQTLSIYLSRRLYSSRWNYVELEWDVYASDTTMNIPWLSPYTW